MGSVLLYMRNNTQKESGMTIREFVLEQKPMGINEWIKVIEDAGLQKHQHVIIDCADHFDMVIVDYSARFDSSLINL
jgi:hypothetical protein